MLDPNSGLFDWTPDYYMEGEYEVPFTVARTVSAVGASCAPTGSATRADKAAVAVLTEYGARRLLAMAARWSGDRRRLTAQFERVERGARVVEFRFFGGLKNEEIAEIHRMHELMDRYELDGQLRWVEHVDRVVGSELYRFAADRRGAFIQPALFEAFGLTVVEAMVCGLPTFAT